MDRLGNTLEEIAWDKAGILKKDAPAAVFVEDPGAFAVIQREAEAAGAILTDLTKARITVHESGPKGSCFTVALPRAAGQEAGRTFEKVRISMAGRHQIQNAVCALALADALLSGGTLIPEKAIYDGMAKARQRGRFEILSQDPTVILDGAHNIAGVTALVDAVKEYFPGKKILLCTGILADKEYKKMARKLAELEADVMTVTVPNPRSLSASALADVFLQLAPYAAGACRVTSVDSWEEAAAQMQQRCGAYDVVIWAGSLYLIGGIRGILTKGAN